MAEDWYYAIGGERHGPVSGRDLKQLANVGKLKPTDLIWRSGMADWRAAGSIRGLFIEGATSGRRSPPPLSKDQPASPPKGESDLGRIAQIVFDEIKMKATDVAVKAKTVAKTVADALAEEGVAEKVKAAPDSSSTAQESETNDSSPVTPHIRPSDASDESISKGAAIGSKGAFWERLVRCLTIVWNGSKSFWLRYAAWLLQFLRILRNGGGDNKKATEKSTMSESEVIQLSLMDVFRSEATERAKRIPNAAMCGSIFHWCFVMVVVSNCLNSSSSNHGRRVDGFTSKDGTTGYVMSSSDLPTPVLAAIKEGKEVWQLAGYQENEDDRTLYIVLAGGKLEALIPVEECSYVTAKAWYGEDNAPEPGSTVYNWRKDQPTYDDDENGLSELSHIHIKHDWDFAKNGNTWVLTKTERVESNVSIKTTKATINITLDEDVGEGFWRMARNKHEHFRGSMARFPDKTETEFGEGAFWPVSLK